MPKTVALAISNSKLAQKLREHGYQVVEGFAATRPGAEPNAYLYTSYRPDMCGSLSDFLGHADISIGNYHYQAADHPATIMLNITGLQPDKVIDSLACQLARQPRL